MNIGRLGVWAATDALSARDAADFARRVERWGYRALWLPEAVGRNVLVHSAWLLAETTRLVAATGIANIYARDAVASVAAQMTLAEQSDGRFLLGLGVSHVPLVEEWRGGRYGKPIETMRAYLEAMQRFQYRAPMPKEKPLTIIAALGPRMLELSAQLTDGAHPYNVTPEHTARARAVLGPGKLLCPEQKVLLESNASVARAIGRKYMSFYFGLPNYTKNWLRLGFSDRDFEGGGSDRLIDAMIAWGDESAIRARIQAHWDAGADHVCVQSVPRPDAPSQGEKILELLAPGAG